MSLGEKINRLRTQKGLSQGELAEFLEVSRQSVSKWETDASVPELDKLVKLSEIFGVSLDELVLDRPSQPVSHKAEPVIERPHEIGSVKKVVGVILLCFASFVWLTVSLYGDFLSGLVLAVPFLSCGLICLLVNKNVGLWCAWAIYLFIELYLRFATGISWQYVFFAYAYADGQTVQIIVAWALIAVYAALTAITIVRFLKMPSVSLRREVLLGAFFWAANLLIWFVLVLPLRSFADWYYRFTVAAFGWMRSVVMVPALIFTVRLIVLFSRQRKQRKVR